MIQEEYLKEKQKSFGDHLVLPMFLYQDDFETNNPLGSHRGIGKVGAVYVVHPCLHPSIVLMLYKSSDQSVVPLDEIFNEANKELQTLQTDGIVVAISTGEMKMYFHLTGVIGDNLAIHTIL